MNYNDKYPAIIESLKEKYEPTAPPVVDGLEASGRVYPCAVCGTPTQWAAVDLGELAEVHLCSDECSKKFDEYLEHRLRTHVYRWT
jgi:hypothetical protein